MVCPSAWGVEIGPHEERSYRWSYARPVHTTGSWRCDFVADDDGCPVRGGFVQLVVPPDSGDAPRDSRDVWYWAYLVGGDLGTLAVRDHEVPRPRRSGDLTVRAEGLWAELVCETPDVHWTIGLEAFGVRLEHPVDALRGELGERIAVGLDLEWDDGSVFGDVLVGTDTIAFEGTGSFVAGAPPRWTTTPGLRAVPDVDGLPAALTLTTDLGETDVDVLGVVPIPMGSRGEAPFLVRVLGRWSEDGVSRCGWLDLTDRPAGPANALAGPADDGGR